MEAIIMMKMMLYMLLLLMMMSISNSNQEDRRCSCDDDDDDDGIYDDFAHDKFRFQENCLGISNSKQEDTVGDYSGEYCDVVMVMMMMMMMKMSLHCIIIASGYPIITRSIQMVITPVTRVMMILMMMMGLHFRIIVHCIQLQSWGHRLRLLWW